MRVGVLMKSSRFKDLKDSGLFRPGTQNSSRLLHLDTEILEFLLIDPCKPYSRKDSCDVILHKVVPLQKICYAFLAAIVANVCR